MKLFPQDLLATFEYDKILSEISGRCESVMAVEFVQRVRPMEKPEEINKLLRQTKEMTLVLTLEDKYPQERIFDTREIVKLLAIDNYVLSELQLHQLAVTTNHCGAITKFFQQKKEKYPTLTSLCENIVFEKAIITHVRRVIDEEAKLRNDASPELMKIRRDTENALKELDKTFRTVLQKFRKMQVLSDVEESMRNGRRVFGIQGEYKRQVKGIIHDESDTGKTVFVEPEEILNIQNEIFELEREEKREIYKILKTLTAEIAPYQSQLESYQWLLTILDFNRAKAKYALDISADMPQLVSGKQVFLYDAKHPVLLQVNRKLHKPVISLQVELDAHSRILVISGPNAGGKSVAMKTIALLQLMLQSGLLIPASPHSKMGVFKNIFCDVGDTQSMEDELSTYSSRLMKMKYFLKHADEATLFFIDEFGTGTDPAAGGAIAESVLDALQQKKTFGVITTHYSNLKVYASHTAGVCNGSMLYNEAELKPAYQLETGKPGSSYAFEIALKSELPYEVIQKAKSLVSKEHIRFEELLKTVRIEKEHLKLREKEAAKREQEQNRKEQELKEEIEKAKEKQRQFNLKKLEKEDDSLRKMEYEFMKLMEDIKMKQPANMHEAKEKLKTFLSSNRNRNNRERKSQFIRSSEHIADTEIKTGDRVTLINGTETGIVETLDKKTATVVFRNMKTKVPVNELVLVKGTDESSGKKQIIKVQIDEEKFNTELDLRGMPKEEAMLALEQFLDKALVRNVYQLRILHGKGTGALRNAVQYVLKTYPSVKKYEFEPDNLGGDGVTLVEF